MSEAKIVTLDEYVCEHWGRTPEQMRGIDICGFNSGRKLLPPELPPSMGGRQGIAYGDGSFSCYLEKDDPLARALGIDPDRGPTVYFDTEPLAFYLTSITNPVMKEMLTKRRNLGIEIGYAINVFVPKEIFTDDIFDEVCNSLKDKIPAEMKMDESTKMDNDRKYYGRGGSEGGDFRFRDLVSSAPGIDDSQVSNGRIRQYISKFGGRHRLGWIYPNQIQVVWSGSADSTVGLIQAVAGLIQSRRFEAHFDLGIDRNGLMNTNVGITGVFYKPQESRGSKP